MIDHEVISRKEAKRLGLKFYFTGKPCKHGHLGLRRVSESGCATCKITDTRRYRSKNREKVNAFLAAYRSKTKERRNANERARYAKNPGKFIAKTKTYYAKNGESVKQKRKAYHYEIYKDPEVRRAAQERVRQWAQDNPEQAKAHARNAKAKRKSVPGQHTSGDVAVILKAQKRKCAYCRIGLGKKYHVDHIVPVSKGGTNDRSNLQITCVRCNLGKGARDPIFHAQTLGMLL